MNIQDIKAQFPIFNKKVYDKPLVYLDNAATTQKPIEVVEAITDYYYSYCSNVNRSVNILANRATEKVEEARKVTQELINARSAQEIVFTHNATDSISTIVNSYAKKTVNEGDNVIVSIAEHHSNLVPWQRLCEERRANLNYIPVKDNGEIDVDVFERLIDDRTRIVSVGHVSNATGHTNPIGDIISICRGTTNAKIVLDVAQTIAYDPIDVQRYDSDFVVFSSHKMYGPTGVGVLYGKEEVLRDAAPYKFGGGMVKQVSIKDSVYEDIPYRFEAGTPNIAGIVGHGAAVNFINKLGWGSVYDHITKLQAYACEKLSKLDNVNVIATNDRSSILSFNVVGRNSLDVAMLLDTYGIAVRGGNHCAQPVISIVGGKQGVVRVSFGVYNTSLDVDYLVNSIKKL